MIHERYHISQAALQFKVTAEWIANCIISHHQGLRDYVSPDQTSPYIERVVTKELKQYQQAKEEFLRTILPSI